MGNELKTVGGAIATVGTGAAAAVTFGQVDSINEAVRECAGATKEAASRTVVRHAGETVISAVATGATAVAAGATLGQVDELNKAVGKCAEHTGGSAIKTGEAVTGHLIEI